MRKALLEFSRNKKLDAQGKKWSNKNEKHTNLKTKITAHNDECMQVKADLETYKKNSSAQPGRKKRKRELEAKVKHWKQKADATGETHSKKGKGYR